MDIRIFEEEVVQKILKDTLSKVNVDIDAAKDLVAQHGDSGFKVLLEEIRLASFKNGFIEGCKYIKNFNKEN